MTRVFLSLGSNVGDRLATLRQAVRALRALDEVAWVDASPLYETEPWESEPGLLPAERPWYLNCVVEIRTTLPADELLHHVQRIETDLGRCRSTGTPEAQRFAPRTLDIDILFYGDGVISVSDELHVPHLLLHERAFVLKPLCDLAPEFEHPTLYQTARELLGELVDEHEVRESNLPRRWFDG